MKSVVPKRNEITPQEIKEIKNISLFLDGALVFLIVILLLCIAAREYFRYQDSLTTKEEKVENELSLNKEVVPVIKDNTTIIPILVYHKIAPKNFLPKKSSDRHYNVYQDVFESQMAYLKTEGYTPLTISSLITREENHTLPEKPIAITFDDGWRSQYDNALPVLVKNQFPATFYIYTGVIGSPAFMTLDDLHALVGLGMEIGGHTRSHPKLTRIDPNKLEDELLGSKRYLEKNLGVSVTDFAYPYGDYSTSTIEALKQYGYTSGRTSHREIHNDFRDLYRLNVLYAPSTRKAFEKMLTVKK